MIDVGIKDGYGSGNRVRIGDEGEQYVVVHPHPPKDEVRAPFPFRDYFKTSAGSNDMRVNGATTPVEFTINAIPEYDIYVGSMSVIIADASATLSKFGNLTALTNGVKLEWVTQDFGTRLLHEGIKTNLEFMRLGGGQPSIGTGADAFKADLSGGGADAYLPYVDFSDIYGLPWGMRLRRGTNDRLVWTVQDDLSTGIDQFDIIAYGIEF
jgi:hypothetical protein